MKREKNKKTVVSDSLPGSFETIAEAAAFWDSHDSADYEAVMKDVDFEVNIERRTFLVPVAEAVFGAIRKKAMSQGVSTETMVNLLLQEHVR